MTERPKTPNTTTETTSGHDEDFTSSVPASKKSRVETKKEKKEKSVKKLTEETSSPKNSQGKRLPLDEKIYQRDLEKPTRYENVHFLPVSYSLGLDDITENNEEPGNGRSRRQAASKAITEQRKILKDDSGGEEDADEFKPDAKVCMSRSTSYFQIPVQFRTISHAQTVYNSLQHSHLDLVPIGVLEQLNVGDTGFQNGGFVGKRKNTHKYKSQIMSRRQCHMLLFLLYISNITNLISIYTATSSPAPVTIKIKLMPTKPTAPSSPALTKPAGHGSLAVGMKRPTWSPPASSGTVRSPLSGVTVRSPNQGLRLGLSRLARVKPLHPAAVLH
ncbi:RAD51-associated protein 1 [Pyxicephalus adspersus]|uniref:RAD51-associated protein 1 n=1 Tax=Pyxicephalus adspersus TaxID=30357 RepID=UPI003B5AB7D6